MDAKDTAGADRQWRQLRSCKFNVLIVLFLWRAAGSGSTQGLENYISWCHRRVTGVVADNWVKRKCPWLVVGDFPPINDNVAEQGFCAHGRQIENCRLCGGRQFVFTVVEAVNVQFARWKARPTIGDASKKNTALWLGAQAATPRTSEDAMKTTASVHANPLESVTGLPVQVSGVPGVSEGGMRGRANLKHRKSVDG